MGDIITRMYRDGALADEGLALGDVSEHLAAPDTIVWIDLCGPSARVTGLGVALKTQGPRREGVIACIPWPLQSRRANARRGRLRLVPPVPLRHVSAAMRDSGRWFAGEGMADCSRCADGALPLALICLVSRLIWSRPARPTEAAAHGYEHDRFAVVWVYGMDMCPRTLAP
jgi:hypothetical protein